MRDGALFKSFKCRCAKGRLEHFIHWHWHQLHDKSKCSISVNTFREKYSFHSCNVKPGCTRNIQNILFCLYCSTELQKIFMFISPFIFIHFHFPCRWFKVPASSPAGLKPSRACLTAATRQISQLPQTTLWAFPVQSYKAPAFALVSWYHLRTPKAETFPCKTAPVKMRLLLHLDRSTGTQQRCNRVGRWRALAGKTRPNTALWCCKRDSDQPTRYTKASQGEEPASSADNFLLLIHPCSWEHCWAHTPWQALGEKLWKALESARDPISWHNTKIRKSNSLFFV